ncbi:UDP-3-O-(3-hydroxymyristoyl)glucosamine N-acyltransferase [Shimia marina]|uniref:UDP-3-O-acylglucosamine N-acyltransferase n=1 Tax=Shimia marina TaxID=321267 RepID=A0A0P1ET96_9RHOB|nr:UDP-3-O-(3-hydroxymyristoyl)glucosamine N-acyltransferase [Shimia marina]CUH53792.1 UDP-3-O-acylglucosamine N-acyltransferase [Shimia marina]SFD68418.1 UDP-3-O-[3-hydroxymyristoyl] glucosamine N-acyltransferase [Shimia marina]
MAFTVQEIATAIDAQAHGNTDLVVERVAEPALAGSNDIALLTNPKFAEGLSQGQARVALLWDGADWEAMGLEAAITAKRGRYAMSGLSKMMDPGQGQQVGIHPTALIDETATLGKGVSVGPYVVIGAHSSIGQGSVIGAFCHIGPDVTIGAGAMLRDHVSIGARVTIGARFWCQPGARIGADGMSFVTPEASGVEKARASLGDQGEVSAQAWARIHSLGAVTIGDDVEIGANTCVDYGTVRDTRIGNGCKIDNMVHIAHNVVVGNDCLLAAQVGIAGSTVIGNNVVMGGQVGVSDNTVVGDNVIAGGASKILSKVPAGEVVLGYPAVKMDTNLEMYKALRRLPRLAKQFADLQKTVSKLGLKS